MVELVKQLGVTEWISLGAIPAAVPHTRAVPIMGTESAPGSPASRRASGAAGHPARARSRRCPSWRCAGRGGVPALGYFAQVPHYVSGPYPVAALALLRSVERHLGIEMAVDRPRGRGSAARTRLDLATGADETTRAYVERLESMVDEERLPAGDELISEIERFLRDRGAPGGQGTLPN